MTSTEIEGNRKVTKVELKLKSVHLTNDNQLLDENEQDVMLGRQQINFIQTKKELFISKTPAITQWFSDWGVVGGERRRIEVCQKEARNKEYDLLNMHAFLF